MPESPEQQYQRVAESSVDRRAELLVAATSVIARRGYAATRFQDVAAEADVAVGTLQHHFGTRRRMLTEALQLWIDQIDQQIEMLHEGEGDAWQRLQQLLAFNCTRLGERTESWRMWLDFTGAAIKDRELRGSTTRSRLRWREGIAEAIRDGADGGVFNPVLPPEDIADVLAALLDGTALQIFAMDSDVSGAEISERVMGVAHSLLRPTVG